jgi:hypothetical protein
VIFTIVSADLSYRDPTKFLCLKVGSTARGERKQCFSKEHIFCGHWPVGFEDAPQEDNAGANDVTATESPAVPRPFHRYIESLVHLELADLMINKQYLDPDFMLWKKPGALLRSPSSRKIERSSYKCSGCRCSFKLFCVCHLID